MKEAQGRAKLESQARGVYPQGWISGSCQKECERQQMDLALGGTLHSRPGQLRTLYKLYFEKMDRAYLGDNWAPIHAAHIVIPNHYLCPWENASS